MQLTDLTHSLSSYSQSADNTVTAVANGLRPIGFILLGIFFLLELNNWKTVLNARGQDLSRKLWVELSIKYLFAVLLTLGSNVILDTLLEIGNIIVKVIGKVVTLENMMYTFELGDINGLIEKAIVDLFGKIIQFIANIIVLLLVFMRFIELYVLKAIAPILIAFFMSEALRSVAINFFKSYVAYVLVTVVMLVITVVFSELANNDLLSFIGRATVGDLGVAFASIGKGIVYILMIVGITRKLKQLIGVG